MPYENIPGVSNTFLDGAFRTTTRSTQPRVLILGTAKSGRSYELFAVNSVSVAEGEFGSDSEVLKGVHEAVAQGADNLAVMRIGGKQGLFEIEDSLGGTLTIIPEDRDDEILSRFTLMLEAGATEVRVLVYDLDAEAFVFDTLEEKVINTDIVRVVDSGFDVTAVCGDATDPKNAPTLAALVVGDVTLGVGSITINAQTQGTDGTSMSLVERYAALAQAYHTLDYRDADIVVPMNAHINDANISQGDAPNFTSGVPVAGSADDALGYVWHVISKGRLFTYFAESQALFTQKAVATLATGITATAVAEGPVGETIQVQIMAPSGAATTAAVVSGVLQITPATTEVSLTTLVAAANLLPTVSALVVLAGTNAAAPSALGPFTLAMPATHSFVSHDELTGDTVPAEVTARFQAGVNAELREVNFAHQLAVFCHDASTSWKTMMGVIGTKGPDAYDRISVGDWVGVLPTYVQKGQELAIDTVGDNGTGLLGVKLLAGKAAYRTDMVTDGDGNDGLAYGGLILTKGESLPNGNKFPYGILDTDEAKDSGGRPIDIGKYIIVTYDHPKHRNSWNGGSTYRGGVATSLAGILAVTPANIEPIGDSGVISRVSDLPRVHATQLDDLSKIRFAGLRREDGLGLLFNSVKTAAHPSSDYSLITTQRCLNRIIQGIRDIAKRYIGKELTGYRTASLNQAIEGYLQQQQILGFHSGARHSLSISRNDRILGKLKIRLRIVPPFTIRAVDIETSLAADETEL